MTTISISDERDRRLNAVVQGLSSSKEQFINDALDTALEDAEDYLRGERAYKEHLANGRRTVSHEEILKEFA